MAGGLWALLSPRLTLWAAEDAITVYSPSGEPVNVDAASGYRRAHIVEPRRLARALTASYRAHSHRSYGVAPFVLAYTPPGICPAQLFLWDAVLRTSGASDWLITDAGLCYAEHAGPLSTGTHISAIAVVSESTTAWETLRSNGKNAAVTACGCIGVGSDDDGAHEALLQLVRREMRESISGAAERMSEDETAMLAAAGIHVFYDGDAVGAYAALVGEMFKSVLGGGGNVVFRRRPPPETLLGMPTR